MAIILFSDNEIRKLVIYDVEQFHIIYSSILDALGSLFCSIFYFSVFHGALFMDILP